MAILVRSHEGDVQTNQTTVEVDSPATITAGDLLFIALLINDDAPTDPIGRPTGWKQQHDTTDASTRTRAMAFTKTAVAADVTNQGTANYYDFTGFNSTDDVLFACFSLYDDVSPSLTPVYGGEVRREPALTDYSIAEETTVIADDTMVINLWSAHGSGGAFNIAGSNSIISGGQVDTKLSSDWVAVGFSNSTWVGYSHEVDISDSPFAARLEHDSTVGISRGEMVMSYLFNAKAETNEVGHAVTVDEWRHTVFSQSYNTFTDCNIAAEDLIGSTEYIIIISAMIQANDINRNDHYWRLEDDDGAIGDSESRFETRNANSSVGEMYFFMDRYTTPSAPSDIRLRGHSDSPTDVVRCNSFYAVAIELADLNATDYEDSESLTNLTSLSNASWTEGTSITIGDGVSDWLVFGYARCLAQYAPVSIRMRITDDSTQVGEYLEYEDEDSVDIRQLGCMWALEGIASSTIALEFQTDSSTSGRIDIDRSMLFALRLDAFEDHLLTHDATDTEMAVVDTDYGTISVSHTTNTAATRDWAIFGNSIILKSGSDGHYRHHIYDDTTLLIGDSLDTGVDNGVRHVYTGSEDQVVNLRFGEYVRVADATGLIAEIKNQENTDVLPTPDIIDAHMGWFTWELAAASTVIMNQIQGSNVGADLFNGTLL